MENTVILYDHLEYFSINWYNLWPFGIVCGHFVYFSRFDMFGPRKIWQPWSEVTTRFPKNQEPIFTIRNWPQQK
jgi:hypothetical protein